ncbi:uncharacterized protein LOC142628871 [Castanea sativa]|uniref:uncharacterized protein LOC142628871 n=1 Tax=Castanea sativa TaxID=21020 RepID=UPI003F6516FE
MRNHCTGKSGYVALKLDMSKAYDRVGWRYMEKVLAKLGFCDRWIHLMMECITNASYSVLINGEPHGGIIPQGDSAKALENNCQALLEVLTTYERASGQKINRAKTTLFFSKSTNPDMQLSIKEALGVLVVQHYEKYLGIPPFIDRKKKDSLTNIK